MACHDELDAVLWFTVYRLEQLAPRPKCVISRLQVRSISFFLFFFLSLSLRVLSRWCSWTTRCTVLEYSIKSGSLNEQARDRGGCRVVEPFITMCFVVQDKSESDLSCKWYFVVWSLSLSLSYSRRLKAKVWQWQIGSLTKDDVWVFHLYNLY